MAEKFNNYTIDECLDKLMPYLERGAANFWMKFTCANCWSRQTCEEPNKFFEIAKCGRCGHFTDIKKDGCNYLLHLKVKADGEVK